MAAPFHILAIADPHFIGAANHTCAHAGRHARLSLVLFRKTLWRLRHLGIRPDVIVLLGDLVDNATRTGAEEDWQSFAGEVHRSGIPVLTVPGNHDTDAARCAQIFGCEPGMHRIGDYVFLVYHDERQEGELFRRPAGQLDLPARAAAAYPGLPLIALQHHPHTPSIEGDYPYHLANRDAVMAGYRDAGVCLSLSGHYHRGLPAHTADGVTYVTTPALCESPYPFQLIRLEGRQIEVQDHALRHDTPGLSDNHCHTELSYCGTNVTIADGIRLSQALGVETICFTEHTFQLYFEKEEAWSFQWQLDPARVQAVWNTPSRGRMAAYRRLANGFRTPRVRAGLEVDLCADGSLLLAPEDAGDWDLIVGAVHSIQGVKKGVTPVPEIEELFLRDVRRLLAHPIDVLAHPFRFFTRLGLPQPAHLYPVVADLLADSGVAAEINFHTYHPDPAFMRLCIERGTRISIGSDSHELCEIGEFAPHLRVLREAGADLTGLSSLLLHPRGAAPCPS
jgi:histidinol phosphatase-like PHP family hydrolase/predicted phosphodiesterase